MDEDDELSLLLQLFITLTLASSFTIQLDCNEGFQFNLIIFNLNFYFIFSTHMQSVGSQNSDVPTKLIEKLSHSTFFFGENFQSFLLSYSYLCSFN